MSQPISVQDKESIAHHANISLPQGENMRSAAERCCLRILTGKSDFVNRFLQVTTARFLASEELRCNFAATKGKPLPIPPQKGGGFKLSTLTNNL